MNDQVSQSSPHHVTAVIRCIGDVVITGLEYVGGLAWLVLDALVWIWRATTRQVRFGRQAVYQQIVRLGIRSISIIVVSSTCIGFILVLQMAPTLDDFGQVPMVANVNAVAMLRELGPLISAIVLTGFAGASIAAELGTMVVGEEIEALESMSLNPVRFLVLPRILSTVVSLIILAVLADAVALLSGAAVGVWGLDIPWGVYKSNTLAQAKLADFLSGLVKAGVFGFLISVIACFNGLKVSGGAAGVGRATTITVVHSVLAIIITDMAFTALFYLLGWN